MPNLLRNFFFLIILGFVIVFVSCNSDDDQSMECARNDNSTCIFYEETGCADPWGNHPSDQILSQEILNYFLSKGATLFDIVFLNTGNAQVCNACHCKTGRIIEAKIETLQLSIALENGFIEK